MDEDKKKQINEAIAVIRSFCVNRDSCISCPLAFNCGIEYDYNFPCNWENIE